LDLLQYCRVSLGKAVNFATKSCALNHIPVMGAGAHARVASISGARYAGNETILVWQVTSVTLPLTSLKGYVATGLSVRIVLETLIHKAIP
jgi:hypothetical protein